MEHRWNARTEVNATITVHLQHFGATQAIVKNVSRTGMLLDINLFDLSRGGIVNLAYTVMRKVERETLRLKALIVHAGDGLAGITFIDAAGDIPALSDTSAGHALPARHHDCDRRNGETGNRRSSQSAGYASA